MSSTLLIVDDSRTIRLQLARILTKAGYDVVQADCGVQALKLLPQSAPSAMILDIQMPVMDGYRVCEELRTMGPPWNRLPIIFLTSLESRALDLLGHEMGAYLRKPVQALELLRAVRRFVEPRPYNQPAETTSAFRQEL